MHDNDILGPVGLHTGNKVESRHDRQKSVSNGPTVETFENYYYKKLLSTFLIWTDYVLLFKLFFKTDVRWLRGSGTVVERQSLTGKLFLCCARQLTGDHLHG